MKMKKEKKRTKMNEEDKDLEKTKGGERGSR